jgi:6-phospho-beta-glucosidase
MKATIIGAAGVRTPGIIESFIRRQEKIDCDELCLMDIDCERLSLISSLTANLEKENANRIHITRTTDAKEALSNADFVITTFRVGGIDSRVIDERVALQNGVLGQETTGPGGFAMALRTIPVLLEYVRKMGEHCPEAWLLNFANPSGMLAESILRVAGWERAVGICDGPSSMRHAAAKLLHAKADDIYLDYFGLNHLGWIRKILYNGMDVLPLFLEQMENGDIPEELPFSIHNFRSLKMIPNEYNYYFYSSKKSVNMILRAEKSRGEQIAEMNHQFFNDLRKIKDDKEALSRRYEEYLKERWATYMKTETGNPTEEIKASAAEVQTQTEEGYAGVALDLIEGLRGARNQILILNTLNQGTIDGMPPDASVEVPVHVSSGLIRPMNVGSIPEECLGLIKQVKSYERLTIEAAVEGSYEKALHALTIHPLVADETLAEVILNGYIDAHGSNFPKLK